MNARFIGGILLIIGTSIGAGMLALPIANAATGFWPSSFYLLVCWAAMTLGAFIILEVNLYLPSGNHMVSMAKATLGLPGLLAAWLSYLFLLYTLLCAYISGGSDVFRSVAQHLHIPLQDWQASILFTVAFGAIVYQGIHSVDIVNRMLMFGKLSVYLLLVMLFTPSIQNSHLYSGDYTQITSTVMILITSFGYAVIVPNLRVYFNDDVSKLRRVIAIGSFIPLLCYIAWDAVIMGCLPKEGPNGLVALMQNPHPTSTLATLLETQIQHPLVTTFFNIFSSLCMLTAFLGVSLCLISFLADGLKANQHGKEGYWLSFLTFTPPLGIVLFYPGAYIHALNYAGIFCVILMLLLPALMAWFGRRQFKPTYMAFGGKPVLLLVIAFSLVLLVNAFYDLS